MNGLKIIVKRNVKLFLKDKGLFFTSLITPIILLVLYATFLSKIYRDSFSSLLPSELKNAATEKIINGTVGGQLASSLLSVSCVTVAFCSNMIMPTDKMTGAIKDINVTPVSKSKLAFGYYIATLLNTLLVCYVALGLSLIYIVCVGWFLTFVDVLLLMFDVLVLVLFGTALSSIVNCFLSTQGQMSAVGTLVSSLYGFISGAYMPISQFGGAVQNIVACLPGTYGTALMREHSMRSAIAELKGFGVPQETIVKIKNSVDCNVFFFGKKVPQVGNWAILICAVLVLTGAYVLINYYKSKKKAD